MPVTSRRTAELGTENAFVVLAEVTDPWPADRCCSESPRGDD